MTKVLKYIALILFAASLTALTSCAVLTQPTNPHSEYDRVIREWQDRVRSEGWSEPLISSIVRGCIRIVKYTGEPPGKDHWKTPREFIRDNFQGDCEDIGFFMADTLKRLSYPEPIRFKIIRMLTTDHLLLRAHFNGAWHTYDTTPVPFSDAELGLYIDLFEFDEDNIYELTDTANTRELINGR